MAKHKTSLLGDFSFPLKKFPRLGPVFKEFEQKEFKCLPDRGRSQKVNETLLRLIQKEPEPCFLLSAVLDFVEQIDQGKVLEHYSFTSFELWLNQNSGLTFEENYHIRAKIAGKWIERSEYQALFPIGMGKVYEGTHFVTAHKSPDLDTTIASFWGWIDAFAARVSEGLHVWNLPGGPPSSQIEIELIFKEVFGPSVFSHLAKTRPSLNLTAKDLMTQKGFVRKSLSDSIGMIDHERDQTAIVVVDEEGFYLGDWRHFDVEGVRQVIIMLSSCLRWFENSLNLHLLSLFAKKSLQLTQIEPILYGLFQMKLKECEPAHEFTLSQRKLVHDFISAVLGIKKGLECTFEELVQNLAKLGDVSFEDLKKIVQEIKKAKLFDSKGELVEERPRIFHFLEKAVRNLHEGIVKIRSRLERLDIALKTKYEVFKHNLNYVTVRADIEEIRNKMASYSYLTVAYPDKGKMFPVGIIQASDLRKNILGTVSLRDFCNREEMTIPSYLDVISVIDHHKSILNTFSPPLAIIADVQSSNSLVADRAFQINDSYSLLGQDPKSVETQIKTLRQQHSSASDRILSRLLKKRSIAKKESSFYIHPEREFIEYLHFLYGIIDDTDLLSKMSAFDIECVVQLLNRMKSLSVGKEVEIIALDDLPRDKNFPKKAAERILRNEDMYSLYNKVYAYREKEIEKNIHHCAKGTPSNLFADTKEQNGCCRIGQTKLFTSNFSLFEKNGDAIRHQWLKKAEQVFKEKPEIDLHIHMISTIVHAKEVYEGSSGKYSHQDELWIWIPPKETAIEHLKRFLNAFQSSPGLKNNPMEAEFLGSNAQELAQLFKESFIDIPQKRQKRDLPIAVLRFKAGSLNSRKAMVSPFLPVLNS